MAASSDPRALIRLDNLRLVRGGQALVDGLGLELSAGGTTAIMGPNGAGKSLTLRMIAGLVRPDEGQVHLAPGLAERMALVFQSPVLLRRSVRGNLAHALASYGVPRRDRPGRIAALLRHGQLEDQAARPARLLSGGERQRLAMVRALAAEPRLLLLDEPTASLDPQATAAIEALVRDAATAAKVVLVTHDAHQAARLADEVVFLHRGRVTEQTPAKTFFDTPASEAARDYLAGRLLT